jgi:SpoVK/Ycf46/Vps4 family AAA+-type ATPase
MLVTIPRDKLPIMLPVMLEDRRAVILAGPPGTGNALRCPTVWQQWQARTTAVSAP